MTAKGSGTLPSDDIRFVLTDTDQNVLSTASLFDGTGEGVISLPNGQVVVDNRAYDAVSQGLLIEKGVQVVIITADGNRILVRPVADGETEAAPGSEDISMSDDIGIVVDDSSFEDPFG